MTIRDLVQKCCIGAATLTMAATFINCALDTSGVGRPHDQPSLQYGSWWCTHTDGGELYEFQVDVPEVPFTIVELNPEIQLSTRRACVCEPSEIDAQIEALYAPGDAHGDDVSIPDDDPADDTDDGPRQLRDHLHLKARQVCFERAVDYIQEEFVQLTHELIDYPDNVAPLTSLDEEFLTLDKVVTNCFGNDLHDTDEADVFQGEHPIYRLDGHCSINSSRRHISNGQGSAQVDARNASNNPSSSTVQATYVLNRDEVANWAERLDELMAKGIDITWNDTVQRFQVRNKKQDRILDTIGIQDGDLIISVNDKQMRTIQDGWTAFATAGSAPEIRLGLMRNGTSRLHTYEWEETR